MRVLLLGSGGREHALSWKISESSILEELFIAPGNAGTKNHGKNINLSVNDFEGIKSFVIENAIDIVVVGPEDPLVNGIADFFEADEALAKVAVVGPNKEAAQLEGSKDFAKEFMRRHNIPTAKYATFTKDTLEAGYAFLDAMKSPYVLKADGLAAGKGVLILEDLDEAKAELKNMLADAKFGEASSRVVIEQFLDGVELSCFVITDGDAYKILPEAKDYKRIGEGDKGLNTGGMGAVSPVPFANPTFLDKIKNQVIIPTVKGLKADGIKYKGFIFFGLINVKNEPYVIEYNCRMGDPETEVVLPRIETDLMEIFIAIRDQKLDKISLSINPKSATTVVLVSGGYPESYEKGKEISGLDSVENALVFHAGANRNEDKVVTCGGRVMAITAFGNNFKEALKGSYCAASKISFEGINYRKDLGFDL